MNLVFYFFGDLMGKVDCVAEACRKSFDEGKNEVIRKLLVNSDLSVEEISRLSGVSLDRVVDLKNSL